MTLPALAGAETANEAIATLEEAGWSRLAEGDWSWVLASPNGAQVARVSPWDAAYRLHAELCWRVRNHYLQRVDAILPLGACGHIVVMERLWPASNAASFCAALGLGDDGGWVAPAGPHVSLFVSDPQLAALRELIADMAAEGARTLPFWGGFNIAPDNVMMDANGQHKLIDPVFVAGRKIIAAIEARDRDALACLPPDALAAFLTIPVFEGGGAVALFAILFELGLLPSQQARKD